MHSDRDWISSQLGPTGLVNREMVRPGHSPEVAPTFGARAASSAIRSPEFVGLGRYPDAIVLPPDPSVAPKHAPIVGLSAMGAAPSPVGWGLSPAPAGLSLQVSDQVGGQVELSRGDVF